VGSAQRATAPFAARWSFPVNQLTRRVPRVPRWSRTEIALAGAFVGALWVDAAQTRSLARAGWRDFRESNPLLGSNPSVGQINSYTAVAAVSTLGIAAVLPQKARKFWLIGALGMETFVVTHTTRLGVAVRIR
jgi:hypothetical protein